MATISNKTFDALEMSRQLREETGRHLAAMTADERLALLNSHLRRNPNSPAAPYPASKESAGVLREEPPEI